MIIAYIPLIALIGFLLMALVQNPPIKRLGDIMLQVGLLWTVYVLIGKTWKIG